MNDFLVFLMVGMAISAPTLIILLPLFWRAQERRQVFGIVERAMERDGSAPVELLAAVRKGLGQAPSKAQDLRRGMFLIALALALAAIGFSIYSTLRSVEGSSDEAAITGVIIGALGIIPGFIGLAYIVLSQTRRLEA